MSMKSMLFSILMSSFLLLSPAHAHNGEDHGVTPAMVGQSLEPRFEARGTLAEITGMLSEDHLWLFVTRVATSEPWPKLKIEVETGGQTRQAVEQSGGVYQLDAGPVAQAGRHALTLTLQGQGLEELLTAELITPAAAASPASRYGWPVAALGGLLALLAVVLLYRRFSKH